MAFNTDGNKIGSKGIKQLTKLDLPRLESLYLRTTISTIDSTDIGNEGIKHLSKGRYINLFTLNISIFISKSRSCRFAFGWVYGFFYAEWMGNVEECSY